MSEFKDGGPAFPTDASPETNGGWNTTRHAGMTLRDYFAAKAMQSMIIHLANTEQANEQMQRLGLGGGRFDDLVAKCAYDYADAMLRARENNHV